MEVTHLLPVYEKEIGDTWITGIASDPKKNIEFKVGWDGVLLILSYFSPVVNESRVWLRVATRCCC